MSKRYSLYIGRFQPFHKGHKWCIQKMIRSGKKVCVAVMDINYLEPENNPYTYDEVLKKISEDMKEELQKGQMMVTKIPAIESVNYGRDVGYSFNELKPPKEIKKISATKIRSKNDTNI